MGLPELDSQDELLRRLPEIERIQNTELREEVIETFLHHCPDYFWQVPASSSGKYHQTDAVNKHGLWLHSKRVFIVAERLIRTMEEMGQFNKEDSDYIRASILLHDIFKQGLPKDRDGNTVDDHDRIARDYLRENTDLPEEVIECVDSHNGGWCKGKSPENNVEYVHHFCDMVGSDRNLIGKVYKPCEEIEEVFQNLVFDPQEGEGIAAELN